MYTYTSNVYIYMCIYIHMFPNTTQRGRRSCLYSMANPFCIQFSLKEGFESSRGLSVVFSCLLADYRAAFFPSIGGDAQMLDRFESECGLVCFVCLCCSASCFDQVTSHVDDAVSLGIVSTYSWGYSGTFDWRFFGIHTLSRFSKFRFHHFCTFG